MPKQFSDVSSKYGAPMGRRSYCGEPTAKVHLFRVRLVGGDYDDGGAYWGGYPSPPLYCARALDSTDDCSGGVQLFVRAKNRDDAKRQILEDYPDLRFFR
jgi:hypothetical protein